MESFLTMDKNGDLDWVTKNLTVTEALISWTESRIKNVLNIYNIDATF